MIVDRVVELLADHVRAARARLIAATRDHRDIASLTQWMSHEAADALWEARHDLCTTPPTAIWRPAAPIFLLAADAGTPAAPPPPGDGDLWIDVVAVPAASSADTAARALAAGRNRFARLREVRRKGAFAIVAAVIIRDDVDLDTIDRLIAELGDPSARERVGQPLAHGMLIADLLGWTV